MRRPTSTMQPASPIPENSVLSHSGGETTPSIQEHSVALQLL